MLVSQPRLDILDLYMKKLDPRSTLHLVVVLFFFECSTLFSPPLLDKENVPLRNDCVQKVFLSNALDMVAPHRNLRGRARK